jgi:hypothetical protein
MKPTLRVPVIFTSITGQRYAASGGDWVPVPSEATQANLHRWVNVAPFASATPAQERSWEVLGSKGDTYTVRVSTSGTWSCTCPGHGWRGRCKHADAKRGEV